MMRSFDDAEEDFQRFLGPVIDAKTEKKGKFLENASQSKWKMFLFFVFGCIPVIHEKGKKSILGPLESFDFQYILGSVFMLTLKSNVQCDLWWEQQRRMSISVVM